MVSVDRVRLHGGATYGARSTAAVDVQVSEPYEVEWEDRATRELVCVQEELAALARVEVGRGRWQTLVHLLHTTPCEQDNARWVFEAELVRLIGPEWYGEQDREAVLRLAAALSSVSWHERFTADPRPVVEWWDRAVAAGREVGLSETFTRSLPVGDWWAWSPNADGHEDEQ